MAKYYYNGVLLPEMPTDVLAEYPYCWIRENFNGTYEFVFSNSQWFVNASNSVAFSTTQTYIRYTTSTDGETLNYNATYTDTGLMSQGNGLIWTNKDILDGSATSTTVFLKATPAIPENQESEIFYKISGNTLTSFADQARRIDGTTTSKLTITQILEIFEGAKVNGSLDGLTNGYDVMFYDENSEELAFYSIKQGHSIGAPVYNCKAWQTEDGAIITFPYTPSADLFLYANNATYADQLYRAYGIDKGVYPYLLINTYSGNVYITFGKMSASGTSVSGAYTMFSRSSVYSDDLDTYIRNLVSHGRELTLTGSTKMTRGSEHLANFDLTQYGVSSYTDLNQ